MRVTWEARGEALRIGHTCAAAELEHTRAVAQPRRELVLPLPARIAHDPVAPLGEALADRVVASTDELYPRISHSTTASLSLEEVPEGLPRALSLRGTFPVAGEPSRSGVSTLAQGGVLRSRADEDEVPCQLLVE